MISPDIAAICKAGIASTLELWLLMLTGAAGTPGITTNSAAAITGAEFSATRQALNRLVKRGLLVAPSRDSGKGRKNRYTINPAGLTLLQTIPAPAPMPVDMKPLRLAVNP